MSETHAEMLLCFMCNLSQCLYLFCKSDSSNRFEFKYLRLYLVYLFFITFKTIALKTRQNHALFGLFIVVLANLYYPSVYAQSTKIVINKPLSETDIRYKYTYDLLALIVLETTPGLVKHR